MKKISNLNKEEEQLIANIIRDGAVVLSKFEKKRIRFGAIKNLIRNAERLSNLLQD